MNPTHLQPIEEAIRDRRVRRGVRRALRAIVAMAEAGLEPSGRRVLRHMIETEGTGTSMGHVTAALQLWRRERLRLERPRLNRFGLWLGGFSEDALRLLWRMLRDERRLRWMRRIQLIEARDEETWRERYRIAVEYRMGLGRWRA